MKARTVVQADHGTTAAARLLPHMVAAAGDAARFIDRSAARLATLEWQAKAQADFVSEVDTGAEALIRDALLARVPGARILGEELSPGAALDAHIGFIVDPLDGTTNFLHGYPEYAISIAAVIDGVLAAGVVHNAATGEVFTAVRSEGAYRNGNAIAVSTIDAPSRALIGTGFPFKTPDQLPVYLRELDAICRATAGVRRAGSASLDLCDVACGRLDGFWELTLSPWDFAAGILIIREAGGVVTTAFGDDVPLGAPSSIVAGNPRMHRWLLDVLAAAGRPAPDRRE
jgi:myo-inositol-1(or 4)-monophosphatase